MSVKRLLFVPFILVFSHLNAQELETYQYQRLRFEIETGIESIFGKNVKPSAVSILA